MLLDNRLVFVTWSSLVENTFNKLLFTDTVYYRHLFHVFCKFQNLALNLIKLQILL